MDKIEDMHWSPLLLNWFRTHRRDLPWRTGEPRDPYRVWVSEIMLQQTKVETVRPYYESWMQRFPDIPTLAAASEDEVLRQWQGLGYYSRARNLHAAVCEVQAKYGGHVPAEKKKIQALQGVGDYTAGAILSLAYNEKVPAVDGNVLRIFSRLYDLSENVLSTKVKKEITGLVQEQLPDDQPGAFNEALMDLGALVCLPKTPHCEACPLLTICRAHALGREKELPVRLTKKKVPTEERMVAIIQRGDQWLIHRRPPQGLLASMWEFPNVLGKGEEGKKKLSQLLAEKGLTVKLAARPFTKLKSVFSHKIWQLSIYRAERVHGRLLAKEDWRWLAIDEVTTVPWAGPHGKITAKLR